MNKTTKILSISIANAMIIMTLILSPLPIGNSNQGYAQEVEKKEDCRTNEQRENGVYKAGCKFNDNLNQEDITSAYSEGIKGYIEQMIGSMFAIISLNLLTKQQPPAVPPVSVDGTPVASRFQTVPGTCPTHVAQRITPYMIAAGSVAHLIGEVRANLAFQDAAQEAVNKNFGQARLDESVDKKIKGDEEKKAEQERAQKNRDENNKQVAAYDALIEVYKTQSDILEDKLTLVKVNQAMFLGAEATEIADIAFNTTKGTMAYNSALTLNETHTTGVLGAVTTLEQAAGAYCGNVTLPIRAHFVTDKKLLANNLIEESKQAVHSYYETGSNIILLVFNLNPISLVTNLFESTTLNVGHHRKEKIINAGFEILNYGMKKGVRLTRQAVLKVILGPGPHIVDELKIIAPPAVDPASTAFPPQATQAAGGIVLPVMPSTPTGAYAACYTTLTSMAAELAGMSAVADAQVEAMVAAYASGVGYLPAKAAGTTMALSFIKILSGMAYATANPTSVPPIATTAGGKAVIKASTKASTLTASNPEAALVLLSTTAKTWGAQLAAAANAPLAAVGGSFFGYHLSRLAPVQCTGSLVASPTIGYDVPRLDGPLSPTSTIAFKVDLHIENPDTNDLPFTFNDTEKFYFKNIVNSILRKVALEKANSHPDKGPKQRLKNFVSSVRYAEKVTDELMKKIDNGDYDDELRSKFRDLQNDRLSIKQLMASLVDSLSQASFVKTAKAEKWMEALKFAGKLYIAYKLLTVTFNNFAFARPGQRVATYGFMAALNGMVKAHLDKAKGQADNRAQVAQDEKFSFTSSRGMKTKFVDTSGRTGGRTNLTTRARLLSGRQFTGKLACASSTGAPAVCDPKKKVNFPEPDFRGADFVAQGSGVTELSGPTSDFVNSLASGDTVSTDTLSSAELGSLDNQVSNLIRTRDKNRKKFDSILDKTEKRIKNKKKGKKIPRPAQVSRNASKAFAGSGQSQNLLGSLKAGKLPNLEKLKKQQKAAGYTGIKLPEFKGAGGSFKAPSVDPFAFEDESSGLKETPVAEAPVDTGGTGLENFDLSGQEINDREDVNIFDLLSSRYLRKYPKLLEKKRKR